MARERKEHPESVTAAIISTRNPDHSYILPFDFLGIFTISDTQKGLALFSCMARGATLANLGRGCFLQFVFVSCWNGISLDSS
jgi:hypothetical protein